MQCTVVFDFDRDMTFLFGIHKILLDINVFLSNMKAEEKERKGVGRRDGGGGKEQTPT